MGWTVEPFEQVLQSHTPMLWAWVFAATLVVLGLIGRSFQPRAVMTTLIAFAGVFVAIIAGALGVLSLAIWHNPARLLPAIGNDPASMLAYFTELGIEFSLPGILSILVFCCIQISKSRATRLAS